MFLLFIDYYWSLKINDFEGIEDMESWNARIDVDVAVKGGGLKIAVNGEYNKKEVSTHKSKVSDALNIEVLLWDLDDAYSLAAYGITTFLYWVDGEYL